ncbi:NUDIX domain-containing protein [Coxiella-like endosymbiont of Rhipicephalus sanguineus]|uniref:NUDIX domain-containing protein n=1 Tax=Coxiella-like endosymbiont of Rhipicephalus sanguineus TaxID=1955402 RepID=UPI00203FF680|nr:NUDIX domain-containing protein [Coxiella-like endosymbiont of Rhipicephalus sanguineus]
MSGSLLHVAIGLVINLENEVLVSLRPMHMAQGRGLWEFPGGKLESGENSYEALCRELKEEVNITVLTAQPFMNIHHSYDETKLFYMYGKLKNLRDILVA